jgi:phage terminase large subunit
MEEWGERDPGTTARRAIDICRPRIGIKVEYDCIGIGSGVKTEYNRLTKDEQLLNVPKFTPWNAGASVLEPYERIIKDDDESLCNKDFYENLKAQAWWALRARFYKTFQVVKNNAYYPVDELISLDSSMVLLEQLKKELAQATRGHSSRLKQLIDKQPKGTKSPNLADSGMMMFFPVPDDYSQIVVGSYG